MSRNQQRILLIEPPFYRLFKDAFSLNCYPLSLGYLAGTIMKETNWSVMVYNADFSPSTQTGHIVTFSFRTGLGFNNYINSLKDLSAPIWREVRTAISEHKPSVVGISAKSQNFASACIVAKLSKEINKQIIVIVGGPHPSMVGRDVLNCPDIDVCVKGEGENTMVELLNAINGQRGFDSVQGIIYRKDGRIVENAPREFIKDLNNLCFPNETARELLKDYNLYPLEAFRFIFANRGCPYNCAFCGSRKIWSRKVRFRSPENVIREIKCLQDKGLKRIRFNDDTFGVNKQWLNELCNGLIKHCSGLKWQCEMHVNLVDEETISLMKAAGCHMIEVGIESGNNEILKKMQKNQTIEKALSACRIIRKHGIELFAYFLVGFPYETEHTLNDTVAAIKKTKGHIHFSIFCPYPGTELFEFCRENGLIDENYDVALHNHQSPDCFCFDLDPERFKTLVFKIEKVVDRKNSMDKIKRIFSFNTIWRIKELGIVESLKKGKRILFT